MLLGNSLAVCLCIMCEIFHYLLQAYNAKTAELLHRFFSTVMGIRFSTLWLTSFVILTANIFQIWSTLAN